MVRPWPHFSPFFLSTASSFPSWPVLWLFLRENSPTLLFSQEVAPTAQLLVVVASAGYSVFKPVCNSPHRMMAVLPHVPDIQISDVEAKYMHSV